MEDLFARVDSRENNRENETDLTTSQPSSSIPLRRFIIGISRHFAMARTNIERLGLLYGKIVVPRHNQFRHRSTVASNSRKGHFDFNLTRLNG